MEQESNFKEAENLVEASNNSHQNNSKDAENFAEASKKSQSFEGNIEKSENPVKSRRSCERIHMEGEKLTEASKKAESSKKNIGKSENPVKSPRSCERIHMEGEKLIETSKKAESSKKRLHRSLKAKPKDMKKIPASDKLKDKSVKGNPETRRNRRKNKHAVQVSKDDQKNRSKDSRKLNETEEKVEKNASIKDHCGKPQDGKREEGIGQLNNNPGNRMIKEKYISSDRTSRKEKEDRINDKSGHDKKKKGKLGGLIFMCSAKTKPDCFRYRVMGVTSGKKDLVLGVKRGLKLFLYDFDLKLLYGIYEAASSGGMRLEPKAFGGSFPVQVRFNIYKDCLPLSESVFKKAIKDNYDGKNKFDIELSDKQVRKICALFRPAIFPSTQPTVVPVLSSALGTGQNREVFERERESRPRSDREVLAKTNGDAVSYHLLPQERDRCNDYHDVISARREKDNLYMTEKDYRTYGLQGDGRNLVPQQLVTSTLDPYPRDQESVLRQPPLPMYRDVAPLRREPLLIDPLYSSQRESIHNLGSRNGIANGIPPLSATPSVSSITPVYLHPREPYGSYRYASSSANAYLPTLTRQEVPSSSYYADGRRDTHLSSAELLVRRLDAEQMDKLCSKYTFEPSSRFSPAHQSSIHASQSQVHGTRPENAGAVSSRYLFTGPSMFYR